MTTVITTPSTLAARRRESPPPWAFYRYVVVSGTILLAFIVSIGWWTEFLSIEPLVESPLLYRGQLWRVVTSALPHVNLMHLAFNVYWIWVLGTRIEAELGHLRTLGLFILMAAVSGAAEYALLEGGVGLSGIVYGLIGMLWILHKHDPRFRDSISLQDVQLAAIWFVLCIVMTVMGVMPVGNIAHGMGALIGILVAMALIATGPRRTSQWIIVSVISVVSIAAAAWGRPVINFSGSRGLEEANLGYEELEAGRNESAEQWLRVSTEMRPQEPSTWFNLGIALERQGKDREAFLAYHRGYQLAKEQDYLDALLNLWDAAPIELQRLYIKDAARARATTLPIE